MSLDTRSGDVSGHGEHSAHREDAPHAPVRNRRRGRWFVGGAIVLTSGLAAALTYSMVRPVTPQTARPVATEDARYRVIEADTRPITRRELAAKYGIRLTLVGVTASGGLVDLRFRITDAAKARRLFNDPEVMPAVLAESSRIVLQPPHGGHHSHITPATGASYFVLIGNAQGAVQRGVPVSVVINNVRVEHVLAET